MFTTSFYLHFCLSSRYSRLICIKLTTFFNFHFLAKERHDAITHEGQDERKEERKRERTRKSLGRAVGQGSAASRPHYAYECKFSFASLRAGIYLSRTRGRIQSRTVWYIRDSPSPHVVPDFQFLFLLGHLRAIVPSPSR